MIRLLARSLTSIGPVLLITVSAFSGFAVRPVFDELVKRPESLRELAHGLRQAALDVLPREALHGNARILVQRLLHVGAGEAVDDLVGELGGERTRALLLAGHGRKLAQVGNVGLERPVLGQATAQQPPAGNKLRIVVPLAQHPPPRLARGGITKQNYDN